MCELRCGHCHACCQFQRECCLFRRQLVSLREKTHSREREKEIRPPPLNIYDLGLQRFLATFFCGFQGGLVLGDPHTLTAPQTSIYEPYPFRYSHMHLVSVRGKIKRNKKVKQVKEIVRMESRECGKM